MEQGAGRRALGAGRLAARRVRAGRAGRALQASVSGRAGAGGRAGARGVQTGTAWACADGRAGRDRRGADVRGRAAGKREARRGRQARGARGARRGRAGSTAWACLGAPGALAGPVWGSCNQFGF